MTLNFQAAPEKTTINFSRLLFFPHLVVSLSPMPLKKIPVRTPLAGDYIFGVGSLKFWTKNADYLGNGTIQAHGYH